MTGLEFGKVQRHRCQAYTRWWLFTRYRCEACGETFRTGNSRAGCKGYGGGPYTTETMKRLLDMRRNEP